MQVRAVHDPTGPSVVRARVENRNDNLIHEWNDMASDVPVLDTDTGTPNAHVYDFAQT